jgi:hypothetical protein
MSQVYQLLNRITTSSLAPMLETGSDAPMLCSVDSPSLRQQQEASAPTIFS